MSSTLKSLLIVVGITLASIANASALDRSSSGALTGSCQLVAYSMAMNTQGQQKVQANQVLQILTNASRNEPGFMMAKTQGYNRASTIIQSMSFQAISSDYNTCLSLMNR